jgi:hypothetical protein
MIRCLIATVLLISIGADALAASDGSGTLSLGLGKIFTFFFLTLGPKAVIAPFARRTSRPPEIPIAPSSACSPASWC